ncbi:NlpC/P60 family protein [Yersinia sp. 2538 StPb PI]|uniref:NlpC/P60 family protein n=2 Tax=Yersinia TaxID=629 RepID=UPI003B28229A
MPLSRRILVNALTKESHSPHILDTLMFKTITPVMIAIVSLFTFPALAEPSGKLVSSLSLQNASIQSASGRHETQKLKKILTHYDEWEGVSYKLGGNTRKGIDCSAYMQRIFEDEFSLSLPRSAQEQMKQGSRITKEALDTGDLVFFKTSRQTRHVGVYIGEGKFIHASSSVGVTISKLDNKYWGARYEQARRINHTEA